MSKSLKILRKMVHKELEEKQKKIKHVQQDLDQLNEDLVSLENELTAEIGSGVQFTANTLNYMQRIKHKIENSQSLIKVKEKEKEEVKALLTEDFIQKKQFETLIHQQEEIEKKHLQKKESDFLDDIFRPKNL